MKIFNIFKKAKRADVSQKRKYAGANIDRLLSSWGVLQTSANSEIEVSLKNLQSRSRQLVRDSDYIKRFIRLCSVNIVGPDGVSLQSKAKDPSRRLDKDANKMIEDAWKEWQEVCAVDGMHWKDLQRLIVESVATDGEVFIRTVSGNVNEFGFALQVLESDYVEVDKNDETTNTRMGIMRDSWGCPTAYYVYKNHPGDTRYASQSYYEQMLIPAKNIIHLFVKERPGQVRGVPWCHPVMTTLKHLAAYEEAAVINARIGASSMGFWELANPDGFVGDGQEDNEALFELEPGQFNKAPMGYKLSQFKSDYPDGEFESFIKAMLRGIASGLNVSYITLSNDLGEANYSSLRAGSLEERDHWKTRQNWFVNSFLNKVFSQWLEMALFTGKIKLPLSKYEKYNAPMWFARSWDWVDPLKDAKAAIEELTAGVKTKTEILAERGLDYEDILEMRQKERELEEMYGESNESNSMPEMQQEADESGQELQADGE